MGWYAAVYRRPAQDTSRNLLFHSLAWHGPTQPTSSLGSTRKHTIPMTAYSRSMGNPSS
jgi:hypothetical protein